jgi:sterol desaturase/sphingolipid hydroxylase (fatty acid hydroxylase superfamily)
MIAAATALAAAGLLAVIIAAPRDAKPALWGAGPTMLLLLLTWESLAPCLPLFRDAYAGRARHGLRNVALASANAVATALLFTGLWSAAARWTARNGFGLFHATLPFGSRAALAILLLDGWAYGWHRLNHRVPLLWRLHRTHHSDPRVDVTTAGRFHIGEIVLTDAVRSLPIVFGGLRLWDVIAYQALLTAVAQFHHANVRLPRALDRVLRIAVVTPDMHRVHHSRWQPETDSNFASVFSVWDRLFGTFRRHDDPTTLRFGLDGFDDESRQTLAGLLATPRDRAPSRPAIRRPSGTSRPGARRTPAAAPLACSSRSARTTRRAPAAVGPTRAGIESPPRPLAR